MTSICGILFLFVIIITLRICLCLHHHRHHHLLLLPLFFFIPIFIFTFTFSLSLALIQPRSQGLSSPHPKGSERRKTLVQAGHVSWWQIYHHGRGPICQSFGRSCCLLPTRPALWATMESSLSIQQNGPLKYPYRHTLGVWCHAMKLNDLCSISQIIRKLLHRRVQGH